MKRWIRFLIWLAGLALFLALTAHFTLRHALNTPKFKAAATGFIQRTTGRPADFERIDYTLFPFSLVVRNAALREPDGSRDFASLKELSVYVDFRTKEITSIQLAEPTIRIVQHPDGTFNFSDLLAPPPAKDTPPPPAPPEQPAPPSPPSAAPFALRQVQIQPVQQAAAGNIDGQVTDLEQRGHRRLIISQISQGAPISDANRPSGNS